MSRKKADSVIVEKKSANENWNAEKPMTKTAAKTTLIKPSLKKVLPKTQKALANEKPSATPSVSKVAPKTLNAEPDKTTSVTPVPTLVLPPIQPEVLKAVDKKPLVAKSRKKKKSKSERQAKGAVNKSDKKTSIVKSKKKQELKPKEEIEADVAASNLNLSQEPDLMLGQRAYSTIIADSQSITEDELLRVNTRAGLTALLRQKKMDLRRITSVLDYEEELRLLQIELLKLQRTVQEKSERVVIIFEGRDCAGKGGTIRRFVEHLNPRAMRVIALPIPTEEEIGQWYFQRYIKQLPNPGEMVFFDRSWYNRAVVEPVNAFCNKAEYKRYMLQVPEFEHMLFEEGINLIKFYFSISRQEQVKRFKARRENPLKQWKLSPLDAKAQSLWNDYSHYKEMMFSKTHTTTSPWIIVKANNKLKARLESIRYVISTLEYEGKGNSKVRLHPDPNIVSRYNRDYISI